MMKAEIARFAAAGAKPYTLNARHVDGAMQALLAGDTAKHDAMIAVAASEIGACDALMLGQISMSSAIDCMKTRSEEHTSELQSLMRISYAVFCLKKKTK